MVSKMPIDEIVNQYESGISVRELAIKYGYSASAIYAQMKRKYKRPITKPKIMLDMKEIITKYESGIKVKKIAEEYNVKLDTLYKRISNWYLITEGKKISEKTTTVINEDEIVKKYFEGEKINALAKEYKVCVCTIRKILDNWCKKNNVERKKTVKVFPMEELIFLYESKVSVHELAKIYDTTEGLIYLRMNQWCKSNEIERNKPMKFWPIELIIEDVENGLSNIEIAKKYGVPVKSIDIRLDKYYK